MFWEERTMAYKDNLFLDDERHPFDVTWGEFDYTTKSWKVVRTYDSFINAVSEYFPTMISFDNDLQTKEEGYDCVKWLVDYCIDNRLQLPKIFYHSQNPVAVGNMKSYIESFKKMNEEK